MRLQKCCQMAWGTEGVSVISYQDGVCTYLRQGQNGREKSEDGEAKSEHDKLFRRAERCTPNDNRSYTPNLPTYSSFVLVLLVIRYREIGSSKLSSPHSTGSSKGIILSPELLVAVCRNQMLNADRITLEFPIMHCAETPSSLQGRAGYEFSSLSTRS